MHALKVGLVLTFDLSITQATGERGKWPVVRCWNRCAPEDWVKSSVFGTKYSQAMRPRELSRPNIYKKMHKALN